MQKRFLGCLVLWVVVTSAAFAVEPFAETARRLFFDRESLISEGSKLQVQCVLNAFETVKAKEIVYVSSPITSGKRLYEYMDAFGFQTAEEARRDRDLFLHHVMLTNIAEGERTSNALALQIEGVVIAPTSFENQMVKSWGYPEFMSLWLSLIEKKVTKMVLLDGWHYSNGSSEEFMWAVLMQMGFLSRSDIEIVDMRGNILTLDQGISLLLSAWHDLRARGMTPQVTTKVLQTLLDAEEHYVGGNVPNTQVPMYDEVSLQTSRQDFLSCSKL
jgi:hypothetical protein